MTFVITSNENSSRDLRSSCVFSGLCQNRLRFTSSVLRWLLEGLWEQKAITVLLPVKRWSEQILSEVGRHQFSSQLYRKQPLFETNAHSRVGWKGQLLDVPLQPSLISTPFWSFQLSMHSQWFLKLNSLWFGCTAFFPGGSAGLMCFCPLLIAGMIILVLIQLCLGLLHGFDGTDFCGSSWAHCFGAKSPRHTGNSILLTFHWLFFLLQDLWDIRWNLGKAVSQLFFSNPN